MIFVDFETDGLNGEINELFAILRHDGEDVELGSFILNENKDNFKELDDLFELICNKSNELYIAIMFWHNFMPDYLSRNYPEVLYNMGSKYVIFLNTISYLDNYKRPRYSIIKTTENLLMKKHNGNAKDDTLDLIKCFDITNSKDFDKSKI